MNLQDSMGWHQWCFGMCEEHGTICLLQDKVHGRTSNGLDDSSTDWTSLIEEKCLKRYSEFLIRMQWSNARITKIWNWVVLAWGDPRYHHCFARWKVRVTAEGSTTYLVFSSKSVEPCRLVSRSPQGFSWLLRGLFDQELSGAQKLTILVLDSMARGEWDDVDDRLFGGAEVEENDMEEDEDGGAWWQSKRNVNIWSAILNKEASIDIFLQCSPDKVTCQQMKHEESTESRFSERQHQSSFTPSITDHSHLVLSSKHSLTISLSSHHHCSASTKEPHISFHKARPTTVFNCTLKSLSSTIASNCTLTIVLPSPRSPASASHIGKSGPGFMHLKCFSKFRMRCLSNHARSFGPSESVIGAGSMIVRWIEPGCCLCIDFGGMTVLVEDSDIGEPGVDGLMENGNREGGFDDCKVLWHSRSISEICGDGRTVGRENAYIDLKRSEAYGKWGVGSGTLSGWIFGKDVGDNGDIETWCIRGWGWSAERSDAEATLGQLLCRP